MGRVEPAVSLSSFRSVPTDSGGHEASAVFTRGASAATPRSPQSPHPATDLHKGQEQQPPEPGHMCALQQPVQTGALQTQWCTITKDEVKAQVIVQDLGSCTSSE